MGIQLEPLPLRGACDRLTFDIPLRLAFLILDDEIRAGRYQVEGQHFCLLRPLKDIDNIAHAIVEHNNGDLTHGIIHHLLLEQRRKAISLVAAMMFHPDDSTFWGKAWIEALDRRKRDLCRCRAQMRIHDARHEADNELIKVSSWRVGYSESVALAALPERTMPVICWTSCLLVRS